MSGSNQWWFVEIQVEEVTVEAKALNLHMLPGLAVSTMVAPDGLGLDVKQKLPQMDLN